MEGPIPSYQMALKGLSPETRVWTDDSIAEKCEPRAGLFGCEALLDTVPTRQPLTYIPPPSGARTIRRSAFGVTAEPGGDALVLEA